MSYQLTLTVRPEAPLGAIRDEVILSTNDAESPAFPVQVVATIRGGLTGSPTVLAMAPVTALTNVQGRYLLRATKPFTVTALDGLRDGFSVKTDDATPRVTHVLTVTFHSSPGQPKGDIRHTFRVHTDLADEPPLELMATSRVGK